MNVYAASSSSDPIQVMEFSSGTTLLGDQVGFFSLSGSVLLKKKNKAYFILYIADSTLFN